MREVSINSLQPPCVLSAMQFVGNQHHHCRLAIAVSGSALVSWVYISDAAASEAELAGRFAAMHVEQAGKCNPQSHCINALAVPLISCSDCQ